MVWRDKLEFFSSAVGNMQLLDNGDVPFETQGLWAISKRSFVR